MFRNHRENTVTFKTFHEAAENFFANVDAAIDTRTAFYSGAITGLLLMAQAKDTAARHAIEGEIMEFIRKRKA
jgi:hypothetical protein